MSEDLIERQNVEAILRRRVGGCYGDCTTLCLSCAATKDLAAVRAIPASCSHAERLALAADVLDRAETEFARAPADGVRAANDAFDQARFEFRSALAAYRSSAQPEPAREYDKHTDPETGETLYRRHSQPEPALPVSGITPDRIERMKIARDAFRAEMAKSSEPAVPARHEHREDTLTTVGNRYGAPCGKCRRGAIRISDGKCRLCGSQEEEPCPTCSRGDA